jgi:hypothetical protein
MGRESSSRCQWFDAEEHLKLAGNFRGNLAFQNQDLLVGSISYGRSTIPPLATVHRGLLGSTVAYGVPKISGANDSYSRIDAFRPSTSVSWDPPTATPLAGLSESRA